MFSPPEQRAEFNDVSLSGAKAHGGRYLVGAKVTGTLNMDSADIGQSLYMSSSPEHRAEFKDVYLRGAKVGGQVALAAPRSGRA